MTADGSVSESLLVDMVPGKSYQVTVSALKGLEESEPSTGTVTTGLISFDLNSHLCHDISVRLDQSIRNQLLLCPPALDSPRGVTAVNVTDTSALLLWQPSLATVHHYVVSYSADSGMITKCNRKDSRLVLI